MSSAMLPKTRMQRLFTYKQNSRFDYFSASRVEDESCFTETVIIPRLELLGAVLSAGITPIIAKTLNSHENSINYWSDSKNILWWIT